MRWNSSGCSRCSARMNRRCVSSKDTGSMASDRRGMKYVDEFREPARIRQAAAEIRRLAAGDRQFRIMEVCGGHTHAIYRFGLDELLPPNVELIHGPGCPVC